LDGEWEHCVFRTRQEALASFEALATDYKVKIERAFLFRHRPEWNTELSAAPPAAGYIQ
jgi:hypothetical protein